MKLETCIRAILGELVDAVARAAPEPESHGNGDKATPDKEADIDSDGDAAMAPEGKEADMKGDADVGMADLAAELATQRRLFACGLPPSCALICRDAERAALRAFLGTYIYPTFIAPSLQSFSRVGCVCCWQRRRWAGGLEGARMCAVGLGLARR